MDLSARPTAGPAPSPVETIPSPEVIRTRLADLDYERSMLRQLLKVAVRRELDLAARAAHGREESHAS
jgi:hypothetical protein